MEKETEKSFDFAADLIKQLITLSIAVLTIIITVLKVMNDSMDMTDVLIALSAGCFFIFSIGFGIFGLQALTFQLGQQKPSIDVGPVRVPAIIQAGTFGLGMVASLLFGVSAVWQESEVENGGVLGMDIPAELVQDAYVGEFTHFLESWNAREARFPPKAEIRSAFSAMLDHAVSTKEFGYEENAWVNKHLQRFAELPDHLVPRLTLDRTAAEILTLAFSINLPTIRDRIDSDQVEKTITLPAYLILGEAQKVALARNSNMIQAEHILASIFEWWTSAWPFCAARAS